jgi:hypothetical protein
LSLYSNETFREEQVQTLQLVMPHLGQMFLALEQRAAASAPAGERPALRVVSRRA